MKRTPLEMVSGFAVFLALALLIAWSIKLHLPIIPAQVGEWLGRSHAPQTALTFFSLAASAFFLALLHLGIELPKKVVVPEKVHPYLSGLPMWALMILLTAAAFGFWTVYPSCQPPVTVNFQVSGREGLFKPSDELSVMPGEAVTISAFTVNEGATLHCKWQYAGAVFKTLGEQNNCQVSAEFNEQPGSGFITVNVAEDFCSQSSIFSLRAIVAP